MSQSTNVQKNQITNDTTNQIVSCDENHFNHSQDKEKEMEIEGAAAADKKRKKYASSSGGSESGDHPMKNLSSSTEEQNKLCCTTMAMTVYTKAWEGAKRAIPHKYVYLDNYTL